MSNARITHLLESGQVVLPEAGEIAVFGAHAGSDLAALPKERLRLICAVKPDHDRLEAAGYDVVTQAPETAAFAVVFLPRAKALGHAMVAAAMRMAARVIVDGQKHDGIDSILREMRKRTACGAPYSKAHGKAFVAEATAGAFDDWAQSGVWGENADGFLTVPGVFSADGADPASKLLAEALPKKLGRHVADLGAGWGYLARAVLEREGVDQLDLVEADLTALNCAKMNVRDARARFHWADATTWQPEGRLDAVVMNPPFHQGRKGVPELGQTFIAQAAAILGPGGRLFMVANRHLPYEQALNDGFGEVSEIGGDGRFKLFAAARPRRQRR